MTLKPVSMATAMACALALPAMAGRPPDGRTLLPGWSVAQQARERTPPPEQARERRPDETQARERRPDETQARARQRSAPRPAPRPTKRGSVVFIGGYFYDPFFGPYPWWSRPAHPYWYFAPYDHRAELRIDCPDRRAAVYVDDFYAGIVDDFDGNFQRLPLPPGGHRIALYLEGFETAEFSVYLRPGSTFTLHHVMERLAPGMTSRRPRVSPPVPTPPDGTYSAPGTTSPIASPSLEPDTAASVFGVLELRVQPDSAIVMVDGERWMSSDDGWYELQLPAGMHRIDVTAPGHRPFTTTVDIAVDATAPLNVSLTRERTP